MSCSFPLGGIIAGFGVLFAAAPAFAVQSGGGLLCENLKEEVAVGTLGEFYKQNLKEHNKYNFSRKLLLEAQKKGKDLLVQKILDRRSELCADSLKTAEDIRAALKGVPSDSSCPSLKATLTSTTRVSTLIETYMHKLATTFDENRKEMDGRKNEHVKILKGLLYLIATGNNAGLEGIAYKGYAIINAPKPVKYEWLKKVAAELGAEAHVIWGAVDADKNPLVQRNLDFARVAVQVKKEFDQAKKRRDSAAQRVQAAGCEPKTTEPKAPDPKSTATKAP